MRKKKNRLSIEYIDINSVSNTLLKVEIQFTGALPFLYKGYKKDIIKYIVHHKSKFTYLTRLKQIEDEMIRFLYQGQIHVHARQMQLSRLTGRPLGNRPLDYGITRLIIHVPKKDKIVYNENLKIEKQNIKTPKIKYYAQFKLPTFDIAS